jgi:hypothetical protein
MRLLNKNKKSNLYVTLFAFIAIGGFLFFGQMENVLAGALDDCVCYKREASMNYTETFRTTTPTEAECSKICNDKGTYYKYALGNYFPTLHNSKTVLETVVSATAQDAGNLMGGIFGDAIRGLLGYVLKFMGWLLSIAAAIFSWAADAKNLTDVINGPSIYKAWTIIRDILNMAFILVLIYTAFTIIFQVDSTNKKRILTVVLMALLVNFSFPIARFIIDVGNSLMYTIFNSLFDGMSNPGDVYALFAKNSQLGPIINGTTTGGSVTQLIASIVFVAILAVTFLMMAVLFVIRIVALAIVIIFSPIAFVGVAVPSMESKAGQWWDYLFKYTFFGPAMALMLYVATQIMTATIITMEKPGTAFSNFSQDPSGGSLIVSMSAFAVPIVILWIGMGLAQKMGIEGADMVTKQGKGALAWAGKKFSGYNAAKRQVDAFKASRKKREDEKNKKKLGTTLGDKFNDIQDKYLLAGGLRKNSKAGKRYNKRKDTQNKEDIKDASENYNGASEADLHRDIKIMTPAAVGSMSDTQVKEAAGKVKQALSRGALYEKEIERDLKTLVAGTIAHPGGAPKPINITPAHITGNQRNDALEKDREKREKDAMDKWVREEKAASLAQSRAVIKEAEDRNKIT